MSSSPVTDNLPGPRVSQRFCATDSDLAFQSSDGVLFSVHRTNLKITTGGFPVQESDKPTTIVQLTESSSTLDILFQFCYPGQHPDLDSMAFAALGPLAEAVEKYKVFPGMNICKKRMRDILPKDAVDVLVYAAKHGYSDIVDKAAPLVVVELPSYNAVLTLLPSSLVLHWALYHSRWLQVAEHAVSYYYDTWISAVSLPNRFCTNCGCEFDPDKHIDGIFRRLGRGLRSLTNLRDVFQMDSVCCNDVKLKFAQWLTEIERQVKEIPSCNVLSMPIEEDSHMVKTSTTIFPNDPTEREVSARFCAADSDVTFCSSDGVCFQIYKTNLEVSAGGFPPPEFDSRDDVVQLTETSTTLELLFRFCYPDRHPDLESTEFDVLGSLAEAAEKYEVFSAINICKIHMKKMLHIPGHAEDFLVYAAKHRHFDILDMVAPRIVSEKSLSETLPKLPHDLILPWVRYYETVPRLCAPNCIKGKTKGWKKRENLPLPLFSTFL